jgi:hypothetical protein
MRDWRSHGSAIRRRMGAPSSHQGGALNAIERPSAGHPVEKSDDIWSVIRRGETDKAFRPDSMKQLRMKHEGGYF